MIKKNMTELQRKGLETERLIVEKLAKKAEEKKINHTKVSNLAFGDNDGSRWRRIRNTSKNDKPQRLTLSDALAVAAAIGVGLDRIIIEVELDQSNPKR